MQSTLPTVFFGGDSAFGPKNIIWAVAHGARRRDLDRQALPRRGPARAAAARRQPHQPEDGHPRVELRQRHRQRPALPRAAARQGGRPQGRARRRSSSASTASSRYLGDAALPQLRRADGVHRPRSASSATPASTSARWTASPSRPTAPEADLRTRLQAPAVNLEQDLYVSSDAARPAASWPRTRTSACIAACAPSAARPAPGTCRNSSWSRHRPDTHASSPLEAHQRLRRQVRQRQRLGLGQRQPRSSPSRSCAWACRCSSRNIFPSNIQGLPTWYEVRCHGRPAISARRGGVDLMVAMNPQTWDKDVAEHRARRLPVLRFDEAGAARRSCATTSTSSACR